MTLRRDRKTRLTVGGRRRIAAVAAALVVAASISPIGVLDGGPASAEPGPGTANNPFPNTCSIKVGLVMDRSNSIRSNNANNPTLMKDAAKGMVDHLQGTGASVAVWSFGTLASGYTGSNPAGGSVAAGDYPAIGFTGVPNAAGATSVKNVIDSVPFSTSSDLGGTNWEAGLGRTSNGYPGAVAPNGDKPQDADVLVFLTDGNPTFNNNGFTSGSTVNDADVDAGITAANAVKSTGPATRMIGVGIGSAVTVANLERVTGGYPASVENDDYWLTNFNQLEDTLFDISTRFCGGNLTIRKLVPGQQAGSWVPQSGWTFNTTFPQGNPSFLTPAAGDQATDANGEVKYQWVQGQPTTAHISETLAASQSLESSACTTDAGQPVDFDTTALDVAVPVNSSVVCEFRNRPVNPTLAITKTPSVPAVTGADRSVTYSLQITNTSALDTIELTGLADSKFGDLFDGANPAVTANGCLAKAGTTLAPGASTSCSFTAQVLGAAGSAADPHQNTVVVAGVDTVLEKQTTAQASATVDIIAPAIDLAKSVDKAVVTAGTGVTYSLTATNPGDTPLKNVTVTDPDCGAISAPVKNGGDQDALLETGESWVYTCQATINADKTNTATANAQDDVLSTPVSDTASASVDVIAPAIAIDKTADQAVVIPGATVNYTLKVTNPGDTPLKNVGVSDPDCGAISGPTKTGGDQDALLEAGETWTYTCSATITADITNTATALGQDNVLSTTVSDTDSANVVVITPGIHLEKDVDQPIVLAGTTVTYTLAATNPSGVPLTGVSVTDPDCGAISGPTKTGGDQDATLESGETWTYTCQAAIDADTTNTATATALDNVLGTKVTDTDTASVKVIAPAIDLVKTVDQPTVLSGTTVTYTMAATNTGDTPLANVAVTDPGCGPVSGPVKTGGDQDALLEAGEVWAWTCQATITADTTNTATADAVDAVLQSSVTDQASAKVDVIAPAIHLEKTVDKPVIVTGSTVTYTMVATNTGDTPLADVALSDPKCPAPSGPTKTGGDQDDLLESGEAWTWTCSKALTADTTNTARVTATDASLQTAVDDSDDAVVDVIEPGIQIVKSVDQPVVLTGTTVTYTMIVTNEGDGPLESVTVSDPKCAAGTLTGPSGDTGSDGVLGVTETWSYTCTAAITADTHNVATVTAVDTKIEAEVSDTDDADVDVIAPAIHLEKDVNLPVVLSGTTVTYTLAATNTGDTPLANVTPSDPGCGPFGGFAKTGGDQDDLLEAGETWLWTCQATTTTDTVNTAQVSAVDDEIGTPVGDSDTAEVDVIGPAIELTKTVDQPVVLSGTTVTYTLVATNAGDTPLAGVAVTDPDCGAISGPTKAGGDQDDLLEAGETWTYTCQATITADTVNTATATAVDATLQTPVSDDGSATVDVIAPAIDLTKTVDQPVVLSGTTVNYTMVATNTGDTPLTSVVLSDPNCTPAGPAKAGGDTDDLLEAGETWTYTCSKAITADTVNTATVDAVDTSLESKVSDSASATVIQIDPAITLDKSVDQPVILSGTTVTYTLVATNTGDTPLTGVTVTDPDCGAISGPTKAGGDQDDLLEADETWTYTCQADPTADTTNTATAAATDDRIGSPVSDTDTASVDVISPSISIDKTTSTPSIKAGDTASYAYAVTTSGDVAIASVTVTDDKCSPVTYTGGDDGDDLLEPGETWAYACDTALATDTVNTATANGVDAVLQTPVSATDTASVEVAPLVPAIGLVKTANPTGANVGDTVTYTYEVTNTGEVDLSDLSLADDKLGAIELDVTDLAVGDSTTATATYVVTANDAGTTIHNVAVVAGTGDGTEVTATDDADVEVGEVEATTQPPTTQAPTSVAPDTLTPTPTGYDGTPLARTGTDVWALGRIGLVLVLAGGLVLLAVRRRRHT